jgi:5-methylcytosine-specific restriction endonuclease McrA
MRKPFEPKEKKIYRLKRTPLKRKPYKIRKTSKKMSKKLREERPLRKKICEDGICSKCGRHIEVHPHEKKTKAQGGKLSVENSPPLCNWCHRIEQGNVLGLKHAESEVEDYTDYDNHMVQQFAELL